MVWKLHLFLFYFKFCHFTDLYYWHPKITFYSFHCNIKTQGQAIQVSFRSEMLFMFFFYYFIFLRFLNFVYWCFACMCGYAPCVFSAQGGQKKPSDPWNQSHRWWWAALWVLGYQPASSRRAVSVLQHWHISPGASCCSCVMVSALPQISCHNSCSSCVHSHSPDCERSPLLLGWYTFSIINVASFLLFENFMQCILMTLISLP